MDGTPTWIVLALLLSAATANIHIVDNGYEGIRVSISADISEDPSLLTTLESIFTQASFSLFRATKYQLYFKEFIFIIPDDWQRKENYEDALDSELEEGDIRIAKGLRDTPYVRNYGECGTHGKYMHLTPNYVLDDAVRSRYGPPGNLITHEWGHLRWGLFDEYPYPSDEQYYRYDNQWHPTRCSTQVDGVLKNAQTNEQCNFDFVTGKTDLLCRFFPNLDTNAVTSLMFLQYLESIVEFCDDPSTAPEHLTHNRLAPNRHNKLCSTQSAWEVMRQHEDFINHTSGTALPTNTDTRPTFRYVQARSSRRVLVLDTSGSMRGERIRIMRQAATNFILNSIETGSQLGIVKFNSDAHTLSPLVEIQSDTDREDIINLLPNAVIGATSIGAGLLLGIEVLNNVGNTTGGSIILITDGGENSSPFISDALPDLVEKGVVVHAFAYGLAADEKLKELASITGGMKFFYSESQNSTALIDGLAATVARSSSRTNNSSISILTEANLVTMNSPVVGTFYIDSTIGRETSLTFSYVEPIDVDIESPDGRYTAMTIKNYNGSGVQSNILRVILEDDLTPGLWTYRVTTNASSSDITVNVHSKPRQEGQEVVQITSWISQKEDITFDAKKTLEIYAEVTRGQTPVLDATVMATVETPDSSSFELQLKDSGIGSDIIKDDGIYSANIIATDFTGDGRYNIKIKVVGSKDKTKVIVGSGGSGSNALEVGTAGVYGVTETEPLEDFQRVTSAGEFRLVAYIQGLPDLLPPARITDFHVESFDFDDLRATLAWTAVGGDMDRGQAFQYNIYISDDLQSILDQTSAGRLVQQDVLRGNLTSPLPAGGQEEYVVIVQAFNLGNSNGDTIYLSIVAVDTAGNDGRFSNVVPLSRARQLSFPNGGQSSCVNCDDDETLPIVVIILLCVVPVLVVVCILGVLFIKPLKNKLNSRSNVIMIQPA